MEKAFFEAGRALAELRDRRLYLSTHRTFEEYCRVRPWRWRSYRFRHSRQKSNYLIQQLMFTKICDPFVVKICRLKI
ncbi:MAG: hypothetical protein V7K40_33085 [Nostoc sp.]